MTHACDDESFENTHGAKHRHRARSARGDIRDGLLAKWNERSHLVIIIIIIIITAKKNNNNNNTHTHTHTRAYMYEMKKGKPAI